MTLDELRAEIDKIDEELVALLNKRGEMALHVGEEKRKEGLMILDENREEQVLNKAAASNCGPMKDEAVKDIYRQIIRCCSDIQRMAE